MVPTILLFYCTMLSGNTYMAEAGAGSGAEIMEKGGDGVGA